MNKEQKKEYDEKYYLKNKIKISINNKKWYIEHRDEILERTKKYQEENKEKINKRKKEKKYRYPEYYKFWIEKNKKHCRKMRKEYMRKRNRIPENHIHTNLSSLVRQSLKNGKGGQKWQILVGYTIDVLMKHLEKQFDNKMNWGNYGSYWWLDHIKPRSLFKFETVEDKEFKECWALNNLQPLEKIANIKKSNHF